MTAGDGNPTAEIKQSRMTEGWDGHRIITYTMCLLIL